MRRLQRALNLCCSLWNCFQSVEAEAPATQAGVDLCEVGRLCHFVPRLLALRVALACS
jgi:hypothetical protein